MASNRLSDAASAYLRSAAHQPIHWFSWSADALAAAREQDKPILLDIGAAWCHWCHVMDRESYEDPALAELLNRDFVCIKVDRDERPDVDARYQRAVQALTGQGGWPLTAFLTPDGEVFAGGTYFPPDGKYGRPGFRTVLEQIRRVFADRRDHVHAQAAAVHRVLAEALDESAPGPVGPEPLAAGVDAMAKAFDGRHGGFGSRPKFPHPEAVLFLLARWRDEPSDRVRTMITRTLDGMAQGGIHDQLGGGFHRYSVDERWVVPHFEKMSYDNAGLLLAYLEGASALGEPAYAEVARGIVRWVREVLSDPDGGYAASQDADVGLDDDGDYFTWTREEAAAVLTEAELEVAAARYDIGTAGEMDHHPGKNVLFVAEDVPRLADRLGEPVETVAARLRSAEEKLRRARTHRPTPFVDRSRYAAWNAMLVGALLRAGAILQDDWARDHALASLSRIRAEAPAPDRVAHTAGGEADLLDDQVQAASAALDAYEATGDADWLAWAERLMDRVWRDFSDPDGGGLFDVARGRPGEGLLPLRAKPIQDAPTPSGNGVAAQVWARLHLLTGNPVQAERRDAVLATFAGAAPGLGLHGAALLRAMDWAVNPGHHLVIVAAPDDPVGERLHGRALTTFLPRRVVQRLHPTGLSDARLPPHLGAMVGGQAPRAYACRGTTCRPPAGSEEAWVETLATLESA